MKKTVSWIPTRGFQLLHIKEAAGDLLNLTEMNEQHVVHMAVPHLWFTPKV